MPPRKWGLRCRWAGCRYVAPTRRAQTVHVRTHIKPYYCRNLECNGRRFSTRQAHAAHYQKHRDMALYSCPECPRKFTSSKLRSDHRIMMHPAPSEIPGEPPPLSCPEAGCEFTTRHKRYLQKHMNVHLRPHACKVPGCERAFATKAALAAHTARYHDAFLRVPCAAEGCLFISNATRNVTRHAVRCPFVRASRKRHDDALAAAMSVGSANNELLAAAADGPPADDEPP